MRKEDPHPEHYRSGHSHGQANLEALKVWQFRVTAAGSLQRFVDIWCPKVVSRDIEIPRTPQRPLQMVPIRAIVGEISLQS